MIEGRDFLDISTILSETRSEASQRTQIGRSYYAAFLEARQYCEANLQHVRSRSPREHNEVAQALGRVEPQLKVDLTFLRSVRNGADYDIDLDPDTIELQADQSHRLARSIISRLDRMAMADRAADEDDYMEIEDPNDL